MATWIKIEDDLPKRSGQVLGIMKDTLSIYVCHYKESKKLFLVYGAGADPISDMKVTHWQPLPLPPNSADESAPSIPEDVKKKIVSAAQNRYGDKTTNQHHEQACFIAGAEFAIQQSIPLSIVEALEAANPYQLKYALPTYVTDDHRMGFETAVSKLRELLQKDLTSKK